MMTIIMRTRLKDDPTGPRTGSSRVFRGGGWHRAAGYCRSASALPRPEPG